MKTLTLRAVAAVAIVVAATAACGTSSEPPASGLKVAAAFYPLAFVAERIVGDAGTVSTVTPPGIEPHDVELSPATVRELQNSDALLYIEDFQPAVDDAIASTGSNGIDAATIVDLSPADSDGASTDPHFWLEPALLADYAVGIGDAFAQLDPARADTYTTNAADLASELTGLADAFATGLATCERREIVVSHESFGYLARAIDLTQVAIAGVDPQNEPSPAKLREIRDLIETTGSTTIFTESLVNPAVAESLAADAGVTTAILDPVESVADGDDYFGVMERNLDALKKALDCA